MSRSVFPGIDPFIEARGLWRDFHDKLIGDMERTLAELLPPRYVVRLDERTYIDFVDPEDEQRVVSFVEPDLRVQLDESSHRSPPQASGSNPLGPNTSAVAMHALVEVEERELYIDIRDEESGGQIVTGIEILSPTNKRFGSDGWKEYSRKREWFLRGGANFVEIDLLRQGRRRPMREPWPDSPYYVLVARKETAPGCTVLPAFSVQPLPDVPVPLLPPDSDVLLTLQKLVDDVITRSRYVGPAHYREADRIHLRPDEQALLTASQQGSQP